MRRFPNEQIVQALRQAESGKPVVEIYRKSGITEIPLHQCKQRFTEPDVSELRELKKLLHENL